MGEGKERLRGRNKVAQRVSKEYLEAFVWDICEREGASVK
jgi:hypothetical protein